MNNLKKLIRKNIKRGWDCFKDTDVPVDFDEVKGFVASENYHDLYFWREILLSHDFAKSWFGEYTCKLCKNDKDGDESKCSKSTYCWQFHLQQLILLKTVEEMVDYYLEKK